ncbi:MAG: hypothetical protein K6B28_00230, partial [Lachnospiraceae bacterium]|nr:hypothetical protein [Lachnospiraceae bacterium]
MLSENLNLLLNTIGASNVTIADYAGFDRTNISRIRSGKRTPAQSSSTTGKLVEGIYLFLDDRNELSKLCSITGTVPGSSAEAIKSELTEWLYRDTTETSFTKDTVTTNDKKNNRTKKYLTFSERLDAVMTLTDLTNIRLSQLIHIDTSLISRYRNGMRSPQNNPDIAKLLSHTLYERIIKRDLLKEISLIMEIHEEDIYEELFHLWLYDNKDIHDNVIFLANQLLESFDSLPTVLDKEQSFGNAEIPFIPKDSRQKYTGNKGLCDAVLRFLHSVLLNNTKELFLYSDEDQSWLMSDRSFLGKWASLMRNCVNNGTNIYIIHNIDRGPEELSQAITSWLPLYLSGRIESFYFRKSDNNRFSHTFFLAPGLACIEGFHVAGTESEGIYNYYTDHNDLKILENEFAKMMTHAKKLVSFSPLEPETDSSVMTVIQNSLTIASMPMELAESFHEPALMKKWAVSHENLVKQLKTGRIFECVTLADIEDLNHGRVKAETIQGAKTLFYSPEQYKEHIRNIIRLSEQYPNYCFYELPETPYPNMNLLITERITKVTYNAFSGISIVVSHPVICKAFQDLADQWLEKYRLDKNTV